MRRRILAANDAMTSEALRVMGFAYRIEEEIPDELTREFAEQGLVFAGLMYATKRRIWRGIEH